MNNPEGALWGSWKRGEATPPKLAVIFDGSSVGSSTVGDWASALKATLKTAHDYSLPGTTVSIYAMGFEERGGVAPYAVRTDEGLRQANARIDQIVAWAKGGDRLNNWDKALWEVAKDMQGGKKYTDVTLMAANAPTAWGEGTVDPFGSDRPWQYAAMSANAIKIQGARVIGMVTENSPNATNAAKALSGATKFDTEKKYFLGIFPYDAPKPEADRTLRARHGERPADAVKELTTALTRLAQVEIRLTRPYDAGGPQDNDKGNYRGEPYVANGKSEFTFNADGKYSFYDPFQPLTESSTVLKNGAQNQTTYSWKTSQTMADGYQYDPGTVRFYVAVPSEGDRNTGTINVKMTNSGQTSADAANFVSLLYPKGAERTVVTGGSQFGGGADPISPFIGCTISGDGVATVYSWKDPDNAPQQDGGLGRPNAIYNTGMPYAANTGNVVPLVGRQINLLGGWKDANPTLSFLRPGLKAVCEPILQRTNTIVYMYDSRDEGTDVLMKADDEWINSFTGSPKPDKISSEIWKKMTFSMTSSKDNDKIVDFGSIDGKMWQRTAPSEIPDATLQFHVKSPIKRYKVLGWRYTDNTIHIDQNWSHSLPAEVAAGTDDEIFTYKPDYGDFRSFVPTVIDLNTSAFWRVNPKDKRPAAKTEWWRLTGDNGTKVSITGDGTCTSTPADSFAGLTIENATGSFWIRGLDPAKYTLTQVNAPNGYIGDKTFPQTKTMTKVTSALEDAGYVDFGIVQNTPAAATWNVTPATDHPEGTWWELKGSDGTTRTLTSADDCVGDDASACKGLLDQDWKAGSFKVSDVSFNGDLTLSQVEPPVGYVMGQANPQTRSHTYIVGLVKPGHEKEAVTVPFGEVVNVPVGPVTWKVTPESAHGTDGWWTLTESDAAGKPIDKGQKLVINRDCVGDSPAECAGMMDQNPVEGEFKIVNQGLKGNAHYVLKQVNGPQGFRLGSAEHECQAFQPQGGAEGAFIDYGTIENTLLPMNLQLPMTGGIPSDLYWLMGLGALLAAAVVVGLKKTEILRRGPEGEFRVTVQEPYDGE